MQPTSADELQGGVSVELLGGFAVTSAGEPLGDARWRLRKARDLVKLLALAPGHCMHREQLMDVLWPDSEPAAAANNLNQVVHAARQVLGAQQIELRDQVLTLHATVDVDEFERTAEHARASHSPRAHRAALALYSGELLPENRYDDWAQQRRDELVDLRNELDAELAQLLVDDRVSALPAHASTFVGRDRELGDLAVLLGRTRLLTLAGAGGAGKTRLAVELARRSEERYENGAVLVELAGVSEGKLVASATAAALELGVLPGRSALDGLIDHLSSRRVLLVLDNCEHLLPACAALCNALLRAAPSLTILATTREPLRVDGEVVFRVPSLAIPDAERALAPDELLRYEAVRLFAERAAAAAPGFTIDGANGRDVARICARLDGLPLALELAAARLGALGAGTLAERLDDRFTLLNTGSRAAPTRQQTLLATLEWSYELLINDERLLLGRLAIFAGGFELTAAEAVCEGGSLAREDVVDVLARLVEKSLVSVDENAREPRYRLLETVRLYAGERLDASGERAALQVRHAHWALDLAEREGDSPRLDREAANLRLAHPALSPEEALRYCVALLAFWLRRIDLEEAHRHLTDALERSTAPTDRRAEALLAASAIDYRAGTLACGEEHAREGHELAVEAGSAGTQWRALQRLGEFALARDDLARSEARLEEARRLAGREQAQAQEAISVYALGVVRWMLGDLTGAEERLAAAVATLRSVPDHATPIQSPLNIAQVDLGDGSARRPRRISFEESLQPFVEISCRAAISYMLANQGTAARLRGRPEDALRLFAEAEQRFDRDKDERGRAAVLLRRAYLELSEGSPDHARSSAEEALAIRRRMSDRRGVGMALLGLGHIETVGGDHDRAEQRLLEARELFRRAGDRWGLVSSLWRTADLAVARNRLDLAAAALDEARSVVAATERVGWIDVTIAMQDEVAGMRGGALDAPELPAGARDAHLGAADTAGVAALGGPAEVLIEKGQSRRKAARSTNGKAIATNKRRQT